MTARPQRLTGVLSLIAIAASPALAQQAGTPNLSRSERNALAAVVRAVESGAASAPISEEDWPLHLFRASDGSHYVAFSVRPADRLDATRPLVVYVRLATHADSPAAATVERSAIAEWLSGQSRTPAPPKRGIAIGDMPTFGAGSIARRGPGAQTQTLQLLELERERAREKREAQERARRAELEGEQGARGPRPMLPFEDFDVGARVLNDPVGAPLIQRALTAGPGTYELSVAWVDPAAADLPSATRVVRRIITLPPASLTALALSSVVIADSVTVRDAFVPASEQSAHPYSIGPTEVVPAADRMLTTDERLALFAQVINPKPTPLGKPDVVVSFRVLRRAGSGEELVGTLAPQTYNEATLPPDFDISQGHPIFVAVGVPLRSFKRGEYRVEMTASDRVAGAAVRADAEFTVIATPAALLAEAPPLVSPYRRESILQAGIIDELTLQLRSPSPSAAMIEALAAARTQRFIDLVKDDTVAPSETAARDTLRALALYALGDTPAALMAPLRRADAAGPGATGIVAGAIHALERNDREALSAWQSAVDDGVDAGVLAPAMIDAALRLGDSARAVAIGEKAMNAMPSAELARRYAAALMTADRHSDALTVLESQARQNPADLEAQWLMLHALFNDFVAGRGPGADTAGRNRFEEIALRYVAAKGPNTALAQDWLAILRSSR